MFSFTPHSLLFVNKILKYLCTKSLRDAALLEEVTGDELRASNLNSNTDGGRTRCYRYKKPCDISRKVFKYLEPGTWNLEPGTWNLEPGTWNLEPGTWNLAART
ncbi:MAG: hypothetical protein ACI9H9_001927 [Pseudoalteromonas tetraodonis]|jgi:hypothetical protein